MGGFSTINLTSSKRSQERQDGKDLFNDTEWVVLKFNGCEELDSGSIAVRLGDVARDRIESTVLLECFRAVLKF